MQTSLALFVAALLGCSFATGQDFLFDPLVPFPYPNQRQQDRPSRGPWESDVVVYSVSKEGKAERLATFERAGVPTIARLKDGRLIAAHQHFPENDAASFDKVAIHFSTDEGKTWTPPAVMTLSGLPEGMRFPFDPTLVALPNGQVRLYFTSMRGRRFDEDLPGIHSAISSDGVAYVYEPGERLKIANRPVIDCAVVLHQGVFHLYSPDNGDQPRQDPQQRGAPQMKPADGIGYHATSADGLNFTRAEDIQIEGRRRWLGNAQSDGSTITFFGTGEAETAQGRSGIFMATSNDGAHWKAAGGLPLMGADPGAVASKDGDWIVIVTGPPREDRGRQDTSKRQ